MRCLQDEESRKSKSYDACRKKVWSNSDNFEIYGGEMEMKKRKWKTGKGQGGYFIICILLTAVCVLPFLIVLGKSFFEAGQGFTLQAWYDVFLGSPRYLHRFWKSLLMCLGIAAGQIVVSVLAGYGFAKCDFPGRKLLFFCLMMLMVLPLQVTLVPNYILLDKLHLLDTYASLILPGIFIPLGAFIMTYSFRAVPEDVIDAARLDGCGEWKALLWIAVPMSKGSIVCVGVLSFLDSWNMVEQPIAYLKDFEAYPLSVALASALESGMNVQLVCSVLVLIPPVLLFVLWGRDLIKGIAVTG